MENDKEKIWNRPWSTDEIINQSENWTLAGDVALLNTIKAFTNNLLTKTDALHCNINTLLHNLDEVGLKLDISLNEFQNLKNTQFIESRVYDDDETLDSKEIEKVIDDQIPEKLDENDFSLSAEIKILDKYYEMVEISISDSEEESERSFILKPKDVYENRRLPPFIGSDDWYKNWYIEDEASDVDSQKSSEVYSESDSDNNLPKDIFSGSETSSELGFYNQTDESKPAANSTFKDNTKKPELSISSEDSEDFNSLPVKVQISNKNFAEQLAAKLGSVISKEENLNEEINKKPIQPPKNDIFSAGLFSNEPPPLNDIQETGKGIFSGGKNLFDDYDEELDNDSLFWDDKKKQDHSQPTEEEIKKINTLPKSFDDIKSSQVSKGLFDSDNSDDDLFAPKVQTKTKFLQPNKPIVPLFDDEPPSLNNDNETEAPVKKKPTGGVPIFGNKDIGKYLRNKQQNNNNDNKEKQNLYQNKKYDLEDATNKNNKLFCDKEDSLETINKNPKNKENDLFHDNTDNNKLLRETNTLNSKILSLFDDDDSLSNDDDEIFASVDKALNSLPSIPNSTKNFNLFNGEEGANQNNKSSGLFDDYGIDIEKNKVEDRSTGTQENEIVTAINNENNKSRTDMNEDKKIDLFNKTLTENIGTVDHNKNVENKNVFKAALGEVSETPKLFENQSTAKPILKIFDDDDKKIPYQKNKKINLFDDDDDEGDIFSNVTNKLDFKLFEDPESNNDLFSIKTRVPTDDTQGVTIKNSETKSTSEFFPKEESVNNINQNTGNRTSNSQDKENLFNLEKNQTKSNMNKNNILHYEIKNTQKEFPDTNTFHHEKNINLIVEPLTLATPRFPTDESAPAEKLTPPPTRSVINLFGSSPPPDDDAWETKSDNFSDPEDFVYLREQEDTTRSNLFDNEPPSLYGFESSGIVKDQSNARIDSDESVFYPHACTSRRLSSDIFSDQQSQDSFLVTKNKTDTNYSNLHITPEDSKMTTIDVAPSGQLKGSMDSTIPEAAPAQNDTSVFNQHLDNVSSDLTSKNIIENKSEKTVEKLTSDSKQNEKIVFKVKENEEKKSKNEDGLSDKKAKLEKSINKIASITERLKNQSPTKSSEKKVSPGKLKPTLNINVNALLPGLPQPKIKTLTKLQPKEDDSDAKENFTNNITPTIKTDNVSPSMPDLEKPVGFDVTDNVNILSSITKERVRNPAKRKPSTRRGRQEALRASVTEDDLKSNIDRPTEISVDTTFVPQPVEKTTYDNENKKCISPEKEKIIASEDPVEQCSSEYGKKIFSKEIVTKRTLFNSESESDEDNALFRISDQKKGEHSDVKVDLFDDEKDILFGKSKSNLNVTEPKDNFKSKTDTTKSKTKSRKSLFDDSSSDDDLFVGSNKEIKKPGTAAKPIEKKIKPHLKRSVKKLETEDDPLSNLLK